MPTDTPIATWIVCLTGFLQDEGRVTGLSRLWRELHREHAGPDTVVVQRAWSDCVWTLAELIWRTRPDDRPPRVGIAGYSWGGMTALHLCEELNRRSIPVERLYLVDAVYRHGYWLGQWRAFVPWRRLYVPRNVAYCRPFAQRENLPRGHDVVAVDPAATDLRPVGWLNCVHQYADDHPAVYHSVMDGVRGMVHRQW